jgi:hypothetical protein
MLARAGTVGHTGAVDVKRDAAKR